MALRLLISPTTRRASSVARSVLFSTSLVRKAETVDFSAALLGGSSTRISQGTTFANIALIYPPQSSVLQPQFLQSNCKTVLHIAFVLRTIPTDLEQATGVERKELEAILSGNPDPFDLSIKKGVPGTKEAPTLVPSMYDERIVGCVCEEDSTSINWMVLKKGEAIRCACGNVFQLVSGKTNALAD